MIWTEAHVPRLSKSILAIALGLGFILGAGWLKSEGAFLATIACGALVIALGLVETYLLLADSHRQDVQSKIALIHALADADGEVRNAIGIWWPRFSFVFTDTPDITWQDTDVPYEIFREFMMDSNEQYISPERNWSTGLRRRQWEKIRNKLQELHLVIPDSAAGPKSWLWVVNGYKHAWGRWMRYKVSVIEALPELE